jgi:TetR/AcrR family transcriptional regulator, regulator of biofilm formation and stress response
MESPLVTRAQLAQGRSRQRRDELLAATIELFAEGGSRAVTHRAVARRAGLPPATTTYYFASIEELLREALAAHIQQWTTDIAALTDLDAGSTIGLHDATTLVSHVFAQRGPEVAARELSIYLAATRDPALRDSATEALQKFEALAVQILARLGVPNGEPLAASIIALIAGTALRRQSGQYTEQQEARQMTKAVRNLIAAHILGDENVNGLLRRS